MEENNYTNENKHEQCAKNAWRMCLCALLGGFLGGLLAFYMVFDQIAERRFRAPHPPIGPMKMEKRILNDMDKMYKQDMDAFDKAFKRMDMPKMPKIKDRNLAMPLFMMDSVKVESEIDDNNFVVEVGLKPFQNDENKVNYNVKGRKLTVFGKSEVKDKNYENDISFSQDFILPENADIANISKVKDGHELKIIVPLKS